MAGNPTRSLRPEGDELKIEISKVAYSDLDGDGARETAALIFCYVQGGTYQVLVFDRDVDGQIRTVGRVVDTTATARIDSGVRTIFDLRPHGNSAVDVQVGDGSTCCGGDPWRIERQWRTYGWNGVAFMQTAGPTRFHPVPPSTDLSITGTRLLLGAPVNGVRHGTFAVTFTNKGPVTATGVLLTVWAFGWSPKLRGPVTVSVEGIVCQTVTYPGYLPTLACHLNPLAVGDRRTLTVRVASPVANDPVIPRNQPNPDADPGVGVNVSDEQPGVRALADPTALDNSYKAGMARSG